MKDEKKQLLGDRIKSIRLSKGLTLEAFGAEFSPEANKSNVSRWEKNKAVPSPDRLKKIAEIGDVSVDYLLYGVRDLQGNEMPVHELSLYNYRIIKSETKKIEGSNNLSMIILIKLFKGESVKASFLNCRMISNSKKEIVELQIDDIHYLDYVSMQPQSKMDQKKFYEAIKLQDRRDVVVFTDYRKKKKVVLKDFDYKFFNNLYKIIIKNYFKDTKLFNHYSLSNDFNLYYIESDYKFRLIDIDK